MDHNSSCIIVGEIEAKKFKHRYIYYGLRCKKESITAHKPNNSTQPDCNSGRVCMASWISDM